MGQKIVNFLVSSITEAFKSKRGNYQNNSLKLSIKTLQIQTLN